MSVIPFIVTGQNRTVVEKQDDFEREGNCIQITNLDHNQFKDDRDSNVSYDLRVGKEYRHHSSEQKKDLGDNDFIKLSPGDAVIIQTVEQIHLPRTRFGQILPKVKLLQKGLSNTTSKVDPGYDGYLMITVFNLGKKTIELKKDEKFCSLIISKVADGAQLYNKGSQQIDGPKDKKIFRKFWNSVLLNLSVIIALGSFVVSIIALFNK